METWKEIEGFNGRYEVSNLGNVRNKQTGNILNGRYSKSGYQFVGLSKVPKREAYKNYAVHRLVANAFISNPENKPEVNHIDNNPSNNKVENLEWVTHKENMKWANIQGRLRQTEESRAKIIKGKEKFTKPVIATDKDGNEYYFKKLNDVKDYGIQPSKVTLCCQGKRNKTNNMTWRYADGDMELIYSKTPQ